MSDIEIMAYLFFGLVILYAFGYVYLLVRKNRIGKKRDIYQQLLWHACSTRKHYIKTLEIFDNSKHKLEAQQEELRLEKTRLRNTRAALREIAAEIRTRQSVEIIDKVEAKVITQKKILFAGHWKVLNNFRCRYNIYLQLCHAIENEHSKHALMVSSCSHDWEQEKSTLLALYRELRADVKLPDPRMAFCSSD